MLIQISNPSALRTSVGTFPRAREGTEIANYKQANALRSSIKGAVRFDNGTRALYSTDASNYRRFRSDGDQGNCPVEQGNHIQEPVGDVFRDENGAVVVLGISLR